MPLKLHFLNVGQGDCTLIEFPSGRVGMVDIDNLKVLDDDTRQEILEEYHQSTEYIFAKALGQPTWLLENAYLEKKQAELTDPLAYYDAHIGKNRDVFRLIITHPHMDHMTGLYRLHQQEPSKDIVNFWHTGFHNFDLEPIPKPLRRCR